MVVYLHPSPKNDIVFIISILLQYGRTKYAADALDETNDLIFKEIFKEKIESELKNVNLDNFIVGIQDASLYSIGFHLTYYPTLLDLDYKLLIKQDKY